MLLSVLCRRTWYLSAAFFICTLTSCLGPRKIDRWVAKHYQDEPIEPPRHKSEQISFISKLPEAGAETSQTVKDRARMLPLLFYWQYDYSWGCTLNADLPLNSLESTVLANVSSGLKQKLGGNRLELTIREMPHAFTIDDKGWYVWVVLYGFGWETITVQPQPTDLVVAYRELNGSNEEVRSGVITIYDPNRKKPLKWFHSLRKTTWQYLEQYDANTAAMSKELIGKLTAEL